MVLPLAKEKRVASKSSGKDCNQRFEMEEDIYHIFQTAKSGIYREVWQLFNHEEPDQSFVSDVDIGIDRVGQ